MARTTGLFLGKFAPLHKGHQYVIEYALARVDQLYVLVYEDEGLSGVSLTRRAGWIRQLYPTVHVIGGHGSPTCTGMDSETIRIQDDYIKGIMPEKITHVFASEKYVNHVAAALGAAPVMVDQERLTYPISATRVRDNPYELRSLIHPVVYWDLIHKVVFLGAESTGKSTLAERMAEKYRTTWIAEYGRKYWMDNHDEQGKLTAAQCEELARVHRDCEDWMVYTAQKVVFIDTNALTTALFCRSYGYELTPGLSHYANECATRYDLVLVCDTDIPFVQDGTRQPEENRSVQQRLIIDELQRRAIPYHLIRGPLESRINQVCSLVDSRLTRFP